MPARPSSLAGTTCRPPQSRRRAGPAARLLLLLLLQVAPGGIVVAGRHAPTVTSETHRLAGRLLGDFNCERVAFYKTHKTGSTTMGGILFRVGAYHHRRFHTKTAEAHYLNNGFRSGAPADFVINHSFSSLREMQEAYDRDLGESAGRITILRDAVTRYISHFYYFFHPANRGAVLGQPDGPPENLLTWEMGVEKTDPAMQEFLRSEVFRRTVFLSLERLEEGLAALHLHCGWPLKELLSINVQCSSCAKEFRRWDGQVIHSPGEVPPKVQYDLRARNWLDDVLVRAAQEKWAAVEAEAGEVLPAVAGEIHRQQGLLSTYCNEAVVTNEAFAAFPGCLWLSLSDMEYEKLVDPSTGEVHPDTVVKPFRAIHDGVPDITVQQMMDGFDEMYQQVVLAGSPGAR
eukprot:jgi/Tetstr1/422975/TSEL_013753.t1